MASCPKDAVNRFHSICSSSGGCCPSCSCKLQLRLALNEARRIKNGGLGVIGLPCCSFTVMRLGFSLFVPAAVIAWYYVYTLAPFLVRSRHTSGRTAITPCGNRGYGFVHAGNCLLARSALLVLVLSYRGCQWLLEQPASSTIMDHPAFEWLLLRAPVA